MTILITGATGMTGSEVVRQAVADPAITKIYLLIRRESEFTHPKITEIIHHDFLDYSGLENVFRDTSACLWCLGISQTRVSKEAYFMITHDFAEAGCKAMLAANPNMAFLFLSGEGADSTEKSKVRFSRVKGQTENALMRLQPQRLFIFRPGGIAATNRNKNEGLYKKFEILAVKMMGAVFPWSVVSSKQLALAMLGVAKEGYKQKIISHRDIRKL